MTIDYPKNHDLPGLRQLWKEAFGDSDAFLDIFFATGFSPYRCRCITDKSNVLAALYWFDCSLSGRKIAYLYAVATARSHRGQGLCRRLMTDVQVLLAETGYAGAVLVPGEESLFDFYGKMGYKTIPCANTFPATPGETPSPVTILSPDAYATLRRRLLPANAVLQEGDNLRFLSEIYTLYGGADWVMAAIADDHTFTAMEFLGNTDAIPGILAALHKPMGIFRTPGDHPFAMYLPFDNAEAPAYFGLPFD